MPGDLERLGAAGLVPQAERSQAESLSRHARQIVRQDGIVIAAQPNPVAGLGQTVDAVAVIGAETAAGGDVVKAVAQRDDPLGPVPGNGAGQHGKARGGVVGRQVHAAGSETRSLLEMQVRHQQRLIVGQVGGA